MRKYSVTNATTAVTNSKIMAILGSHWVIRPARSGETEAPNKAPRTANMGCLSHSGIHTLIPAPAGTALNKSGPRIHGSGRLAHWNSRAPISPRTRERMTERVLSTSLTQAKRGGS